MKAELKRDAINEMLEELGKAVTSGDLAGVSKLYAYPVLLISDGGGRVLKKPAELEALFAEGRDWYNIAQGMTEARGKLEKIEQLAEQTAAINVRWLGYDSKGHENYREKWYYIVQNLEGVPRIRVSMTLTK
jgi:hypothetical protein